MASRKSRYTRQARFRPRRGLRRRPPWRCARPRRAAPGCRSSGSGAPGSSRARSPGIWSGGRLSPFFSGTQMRPSLRSDSLISVSLRLILAGDRNAGGMNLREAGIGEQRAALVRAPDGRGVASPWRWWRGKRRCRSRRWPAPRRRPACDSISPVIRLRVTMPRAWPSTTIRSSISVRGNIFTWPGADLPLQRLVGAEQQLLPRLAARVERARDLRAAEASGCPGSRRIRARTARPAPRTGR